VKQTMAVTRLMLVSELAMWHQCEWWWRTGLWMQQ